MRCEDVLRALDEMDDDLAPSFSSADAAPSLRSGQALRGGAMAIRGHLARCSSCAEAWGEWRMLHAGFRAIANDRLPDPQLAFASRVLRRLDDVVHSGGGAAEFFERIGRRFVLAGLVVVMLLIAGLVLPASGPFRGPATDEPYLAQTEPSRQADASFLGYGSGDSTSTSTTGGNQNQK